MPFARRERLPARRASETFGFDHGGNRYRATLGFYPREAGQPARLGEIFMGAAKDGSALDVYTRDTAILASIALQHGASVETLCHALTRDANGKPEGALGVLLELLLKDGGGDG
jgi:hypothetical protein